MKFKITQLPGLNIKVPKFHENLESNVSDIYNIEYALEYKKNTDFIEKLTEYIYRTTTKLFTKHTLDDVELFLTDLKIDSFLNSLKFETLDKLMIKLKKCKMGKSLSGNFVYTRIE